MVEKVDGASIKINLLGVVKTNFVTSLGIHGGIDYLVVMSYLLYQMVETSSLPSQPILTSTTLILTLVLNHLFGLHGKKDGEL